MSDLIPFDYFAKLDLRVAKILEAEALPESEKLVRLQVALGEEKRQIVAGIGKFYSPEALIGKEIVIVANLESRKLMGHESQGMLLAATNIADSRVVLIRPDEVADPGSRV